MGNNYVANICFFCFLAANLSWLTARLALRSNMLFVKFQKKKFIKIECGLYLLDRFDVLISKIIFKKWKNIIGMLFGTKSYLKSNRYYTLKHPLNLCQTSVIGLGLEI